MEWVLATWSRRAVWVYLKYSAIFSPDGAASSPVPPQGPAVKPPVNSLFFCSDSSNHGAPISPCNYPKTTRLSSRCEALCSQVTCSPGAAGARRTLLMSSYKDSLPWFVCYASLFLIITSKHSEFFLMFWVKQGVGGYIWKKKSNEETPIHKPLNLLIFDVMIRRESFSNWKFFTPGSYVCIFAFINSSHFLKFYNFDYELPQRVWLYSLYLYCSFWLRLFSRVMIVVSY